MYVSFRLPATEVEALRRTAHERGTTLSAEIRRAIRALLKVEGRS